LCFASRRGHRQPHRDICLHRGRHRNEPPRPPTGRLGSNARHTGRSHFGP
jgi:hypothetical protein